MVWAPKHGRPTLYGLHACAVGRVMRACSRRANTNDYPGFQSDYAVMSAGDRRLIRYGVPCVAVLAGGVCAAALTNAVGNTLATVLIGGGLLAIVIFLFRDMGLVADTSEAEPQHVLTQRVRPARSIIAGRRRRRRAPGSPGAAFGGAPPRPRQRRRLR